MSFMTGCRSATVVATLLLSSLGCSSSADGTPLVRAEGTVTLDGKPLANAIVMLAPQGETRGESAFFGRTDTAGRFTAASPDGKRKGAAVGNYKVTISKLVKPDGSDFLPDPNSGPEDTGGFRQLLPSVYSDEAQTTLTADVPDGGTKSLEFNLKSRMR